MLKVMAIMAGITTMALGFIAEAHAQTPRPASEDLKVPFGEGEIFLRNKRPEGVASFKSDRIVLFVHGATYPGTVFDLPLAGKSWMDTLAERGFDSYALDLPSYGHSTRAPAMEVAPQDNAPLTRRSEAVKAVGAVVEFHLTAAGLRQNHADGWSWGTTIVASFATERAKVVERVVLFAPVWLRTTPSLSTSRARRTGR